MSKLRAYLKSPNFTIQTDEKCLKWILNFAGATGCSAHWRPCNFKFDFDLIHHAGIKHQAAGVLYCLQMTKADDKPVENDLQVAMLDTYTTVSTNGRLENHQQATAKIVEDSDSLEHRHPVSLKTCYSTREKTRTEENLLECRDRKCEVKNCQNWTNCLRRTHWRRCLNSCTTSHSRTPPVSLTQPCNVRSPRPLPNSLLDAKIFLLAAHCKQRI